MATLETVFGTQREIGTLICSSLPIQTCARFGRVSRLCLTFFQELLQKRDAVLSYNRTHFFKNICESSGWKINDEVFERLPRSILGVLGTRDGRLLFLDYWAHVQTSRPSQKDLTIRSFFPQFSKLFVQCDVLSKSVEKMRLVLNNLALPGEEEGIDQTIITRLRGKGYKQHAYPILEETMRTIFGALFLKPGSDAEKSFCAEMNKFVLGQFEESELEEMAAVFKEALPYIEPYFAIIRATLEGVEAEDKEKTERESRDLPQDLIVPHMEFLRAFPVPEEEIRKVQNELRPRVAHEEKLFKWEMVKLVCIFVIVVAYLLYTPSR
jgi:hypothetical protein